MITKTDTCLRCDQCRVRLVKPGRALDLSLIAVLLVDVYVLWGHRPMLGSGPAVPASASQEAGQ